MAAESSLTRKVRRAIEADPPARDLLARNLVNVRGLARWMLDRHAWDATEEAVVSAVRRVRAALGGDERFGAARQLLRQAHVNTRARMCSVELAATRSVLDRLPDLFRTVDHAKGEKLRVISSDRGFKVIVDETNLAALGDLFGASATGNVRRGLTEIDVVVPPEHGQVPGILALVTNALAMNGVNVVELVDGISQHMVFVQERDAGLAYDILRAITGDAEPVAAA